MDRSETNFSRGRGSDEKPEIRSIVFRDGESVSRVADVEGMCSQTKAIARLGHGRGWGTVS